jgi:anti-sigma-K factor RskA
VYARDETANNASQPRRAEAESRLEALKARLAAWRAAALGAAAAAAAIALMWFAGLEPPLREATAPERYVAMLQGQQGETGFLVTMEMEERRVLVRPVAAEAPAPRKAYELWAMREGGKAPLTLGLVETGASTTFKAPPELERSELEEGLELCITLEAPSGAPSGQQMGEIIFAGNLVRQTP